MACLRWRMLKKAIISSYKEQDNVYGMKISDMDLWIDPTSTGCQAKYMNHSCEPNCNLEQWAVDGLPCMCFFAIEDINSGEELTFDYNWELKAVSKEMFKKMRRSVSARNRNVVYTLKG